MYIHQLQGEVNMKYLKCIKIALVIVLVLPILSFAENNSKRDQLKGTYSLEFLTACAINGGSYEINSVGKFTLDGRGNFVSRKNGVYIFPNGGISGQTVQYCSGAYFIERVNKTFIVNIPEQLCVGRISTGSAGATPEPEPRAFNNFNLLVRDVSLIFQKGGKKAGIYSDIPPIDVPVDVETFNQPDLPPDASFDQRCSRNGSFNRKGGFSVLPQPNPAASPPPS